MPSTSGLSLQLRLGPLRRLLRVGVCSFAALSFFAVKSVRTDEIADKQVTAFLNLTILKLDLYAAACKDHVSFDTTLVRQKFKEYSEDKNGFDYFEPMGQKVDEIRERLNRAPPSESQRQCMDSLRSSMRDYMAMRDVFMHRMRDEKTIPPIIGPEIMDVR